MDNVQILLEKVAARKQQKPKQRKKKPSGGRKPRDVYAPDMSKSAPGAQVAPKKATAPTSAPAPAPKKVPVSSSTSSSALKKTRFTPKKLGLVAAGAAGTGLLVHKVRQARARQEMQ